MTSEVTPSEQTKRLADIKRADGIFGIRKPYPLPLPEGLELSRRLDEALARIEALEDPDAIDKAIAALPGPRKTRLSPPPEPKRAAEQEHEADRDIREGRVARFTTASDMIAALKADPATNTVPTQFQLQSPPPQPQGEPANFKPLEPETAQHDMAVGPCKCGAWHESELQPSPPPPADVLTEEEQATIAEWRRTGMGKRAIPIIERLRKENEQLREVANDVVGDANMLYHFADMAGEGEGTGKAAIRLLRETIDRLAAELEQARKEQCICAAIRLPSGEVWRGHRHNDAMHTAMDAQVPATEVHNAEQGFITSRNRFVSRREGADIQRAAGIPSADYGGPVKGDLFSEDLYLRNWREAALASKENSDA